MLRAPTRSRFLSALAGILLLTAPSPLGAAQDLAQEAYVKASNTGGEDFFGAAVALDGDTLVVGAHSERSDATGIDGHQADNSLWQAGAVYVFVRQGATWSQQAYIKASNTGDSDRFGDSVALSGDTLVVGAPNEKSDATGVNGDEHNDDAPWSGAAYVFVRSGSTWSQQAYLKAVNTGAGDNFGHAVGISGDTIVVGAPNEDSAATGVDGDPFDDFAGLSGAAYVFVRSGSTWSQQAYLKASNTDPSDKFGMDVAISGDTVVVGASWEASAASGVDGDEEDDSLPRSGAAYVFSREGGVWSQQAYLKSSDPDQEDYFGHYVSAAGDTAAVSVHWEDSASTGVDGDASDDSAEQSGAVFVFRRDGKAWSQEAYIKASNTGAGDRFGHELALVNDLLAVGAGSEDSDAVGVGGDQSDDSQGSSGAAYLFERDGGSWSQAAYVKASNTEGGDSFGEGVALGQAILAVGAQREDSRAEGINGDQQDANKPRSGAVYVFDLEAPGGAGAPFCFGDGNGTPCPCAAVVSAGEGCPNSTGSGAILSGSGSTVFSADTFQLHVAQAKPDGMGLAIQGIVQRDGGLGVALGDGLLCLTPRLRSQVSMADGTGAVTIGDWRGQAFGSYPGAVYYGAPTYYQYWYRDPANPCSGSGFNFSNAWAAHWR